MNISCVCLFLLILQSNFLSGMGQQAYQRMEQRPRQVEYITIKIPNQYAESATGAPRQKPDPLSSLLPEDQNKEKFLNTNGILPRLEPLQAHTQKELSIDATREAYNNYCKEVAALRASEITTLQQTLAHETSRRKLEMELACVQGFLSHAACISSVDPSVANVQFLELAKLSLPTHLLNDALQKVKIDLENLLYDESTANFHGITTAEQAAQARQVIEPFQKFASGILNGEILKQLSPDSAADKHCPQSPAPAYSPEQNQCIERRQKSAWNQKLSQILHAAAIDKEGNTPLHYAAAYAPNLLRLLAKIYREFVDAANNAGFTTIHLLLLHNRKDNNIQYLKTLKKAGASFNLPYSSGCTILEKANRNCLMKPSKEGPSKTLEWLLDTDGLSLTLQALDPLCLAIINQTLASKLTPTVIQNIMRGLFKRINNLDQQDDAGNSLLHRFIRPDVPPQNEVVIVFLIEAGASIALQNNEGNTPLHLALISGYPFLAENLLKTATLKPKQIEFQTLEDRAFRTVMQNALPVFKNFDAAFVSRNIPEAICDSLCRAIVRYTPLETQRELVKHWHQADKDPCLCLTLLGYALDWYYEELFNLLQLTNNEDKTLKDLDEPNALLTRIHLLDVPELFKKDAAQFITRSMKHAFRPKKNSLISFNMPTIMKVLKEKLGIDFHEFDALETPNGLTIVNQPS